MQTATHSQPPSIDLGRLHAVIDDVIDDERVDSAPVADRADRAAEQARARESFCAELAAQRLHVGLTLDALSAATKINPSLFAQLERGDLSHWPRGIYRRAFFREYVTAVGLPPDETLSAFTELFPDTNTPSASPPSIAGGLGRQPLRLTMAPGPTPRWIVRRAFLAAAAVDGAALLLVSAVLSWSLSAGFGTVLGVVAAVYSLLTTAVLGRSVASWWVHRGIVLGRDRTMRDALRALAPAPPSE